MSGSSSSCLDKQGCAPRKGRTVHGPHGRQAWTVEAWEMERGRLTVPLLDGLFQSTVVPKSPLEIHPVRLDSRLRSLVTGRLANAATGIAFPPSYLVFWSPHSCCSMIVLPERDFTPKLGLRLCFLGDLGQLKLIDYLNGYRSSAHMCPQIIPLLRNFRFLTFYYLFLSAI